MEPDILATPGHSASRSLGTPDVMGPGVLRSVAAPPERVEGTSVRPAHGAPRARVATGPLNGNGNGHGRIVTADWSARAVAATPEARHEIEFRAADSFYIRAGKRIVDVIGAALALVITAPLVAIMAILIKIESRGPVLYKSPRVGRGGRVFTFYKLRSMVNDAHSRRKDIDHLNECDGPVFKISNDPRVTRIGRWLRRTSIDEIPQFLNVLRGEMSLVGPRPPIPEEVARYEPWQLKRLSVRPGLTCLWQISGRSRIGFEEWMRLDLQYIRHQSLEMDVKILLRTIPAVLSRDGAY